MSLLRSCLILNENQLELGHPYRDLSWIREIAPETTDENSAFSVWARRMPAMF